MRRCFIHVWVAFFVAGISIYAFAHGGETHKDMGAETIKIETVIMPPVTFPHRMHQEELGDCAICHDLFPKKAGVIRMMINQEKLKKKQVMTDKCIACHKHKKSIGEAAGPTTCGRCHISSKK